MTTRTRQTAIAAAMLLATAVATTSTAQVPTPEIHVIEETAGGGAASVYIMRAPLPNTVDQVGLAIHLRHPGRGDRVPRRLPAGRHPCAGWRYAPPPAASSASGPSSTTTGHGPASTAPG